MCDDGQLSGPQQKKVKRLWRNLLNSSPCLSQSHNERPDIAIVSADQASLQRLSIMHQCMYVDISALSPQHLQAIAHHSEHGNSATVGGFVEN